jgi:hypothetical protein
MPRPELKSVEDLGLKPEKPAATSTSKPESTLRSYAHKIEDFASGGAIGATGGARKNMDYGVGGSFNHAHEDD